MSIHVVVRFYEELNDYLPQALRKRDLVKTAEENLRVRDLIEQSGIPVEAVDLVLVNGEPADLQQHLSENDRVSVYPVFESFDISSVPPLPRPTLRNLKFLADTHLGKLSKYLRMLGFDTIYTASFDPNLISLAATERRIILTRNQRLTAGNKITRGYLIKQEIPNLQLMEVVERFHLAGMIDPLSRCLRCNARVENITREYVRNRLDTAVIDKHGNFAICPVCRRIYWNGTHAERMIAWITRQFG